MFLPAVNGERYASSTLMILGEFLMIAVIFIKHEAREKLRKTESRFCPFFLFSGKDTNLEMEGMFRYPVGGTVHEQGRAQAEESAGILCQVGGYVLLALRLDNGVAA